MNTCASGVVTFYLANSLLPVDEVDTVATGYAYRALGLDPSLDTQEVVVSGYAYPALGLDPSLDMPVVSTLDIECSNDPVSDYVRMSKIDEHRVTKTDDFRRYR